MIFQMARGVRAPNPEPYALGFFHTVGDEFLLAAINRQIEHVGYFTDGVIQGRVRVSKLDLVLTFAPDEEGELVLATACLAQRVRGGTTGKQGVKWSNVVHVGVSTHSLITRLPQDVGDRVSQSLFHDSSRPSASDWDAVWRELKALRPDLVPAIENLERMRRGVVLRFSDEREERLFCQRDAVGVALDLAGIPRASTFSQIAQAVTGDTPLLDALCGSPTERIVLSHDVRAFDGFAPIGAMSDHKCSFRYGEVSLDVYNVDVRRGERVLGVDLVYYNHRFASFVLVQYKMMEGDEETWSYVRDAQCIEEEARMDESLADFGRLQCNGTPDAFRLSANPFFFKLCKRDRSLLLDTSALTQGLYLHLDYWKALHGPFGDASQGIGFGNAERWICKTDFVNFVSRGWVGTRAVTAQWLIPYLERAKARGRSTIVGVSKSLAGE